MKNLMYDVLAIVATVLLVFPSAIYAASLAIIEVFKTMPVMMIELFDELKEEK